MTCDWPAPDRRTRVLSPTWWGISHRADPRSCLIADRHYNRQKIGSPQFVPPGRCFVLRHEDDALWTTSYPYAQYVKHAWGGAWVNSLFRNESDRLSSDIIYEAVALTVRFALESEKWGNGIPDLGLVSFVDAKKTRKKRDPGRCYTKAGFHHVGMTKGGLYVFQMLPHEMPIV
jgi:hypothetical protein